MLDAASCEIDACTPEIAQCVFSCVWFQETYFFWAKRMQRVWHLCVLSSALRENCGQSIIDFIQFSILGLRALNVPEELSLTGARVVK